jgi:hypothetical protein
VISNFAPVVQDTATASALVECGTISFPIYSFLWMKPKFLMMEPDRPPFPARSLRTGRIRGPANAATLPCLARHKFWLCHENAMKIQNSDFFLINGIALLSHLIILVLPGNYLEKWLSYVFAMASPWKFKIALFQGNCHVSGNPATFVANSDTTRQHGQHSFRS